MRPTPSRSELKRRLAAAKARGTQLGGPRVSAERWVGIGLEARLAKSAEADKRSATLVLPVIHELQAAGSTSLRQIAAGLNERKHHHTTRRRMERRTGTAGADRCSLVSRQPRTPAEATRKNLAGSLWRVLDFENKVGVSVDTYRIRLIVGNMKQPQVILCPDSEGIVAEEQLYGDGTAHCDGCQSHLLRFKLIGEVWKYPPHDKEGHLLRDRGR
jgi:hypothetical protein